MFQKISAYGGEIAVESFNLRKLNIFQYLKLYTYDGILSGCVVQNNSHGRAENVMQPDLFSGGE